MASSVQRIDDRYGIDTPAGVDGAQHGVVVGGQPGEGLVLVEPHPLDVTLAGVFSPAPPTPVGTTERCGRYR